MGAPLSQPPVVMRFRRRLPAGLAVAVASLLAVIPLCWFYRGWFDVWSMPDRGSPELQGLWGDLVPMFGAWHQLTHHALFTEHVFPLWNRFTHSGEPYFAKPQVAILSMSTAWGMVFPYPLSLKVDMLVHVFLLAMGMVVLARNLGASWWVSCAAGAMSLVNEYYVFHLHRGHLNFVNGFAASPWMLLACFKALEPRQRRPVPWAVAVGLCATAQVYEGADVTILYGGLALVLICVAHVLQHRDRPSLVAVVRTGLVAGLTAGGLGAFKVLPMLEYSRIGNRQLGVPWQQASEPAEMLSGPSVNTLGLGLALLALLAWRRRLGPLVALTAMAILGYATAHSTAVFKVLYTWVPLVNAQRHPSRAEVLTALAVPLLWALGSAGLRRSFPRFRVVTNMVLGALLTVSVVQQYRVIPNGPPLVDARVEPASNPLINRAREMLNDGSRLHVMESENRHWGIEHVTIPNGVENVMGCEALWLPEYMSPQFYMPQQVSFLDAAPRRPARIFGLLSARLLSSQRPRNHPGLTLLEQLPPCRVCHPSKSAGPFLYLNEESLPPAFTATRAILFVGTGREADLAFQSLLLDDAWNPSRVVLLRAGLRGDAVTSDQLAMADLVLVHPSGKVDASVKAIQLQGTSLDEATRSAIASLSEGATNLLPAVLRRDGDDYQACPADDGKLLVTTSKFALFPGWSAHDEAGEEFPLLRANGVTTAVARVNTQGHKARGCLMLTYRPASVVRGGIISLVSIPLIGVLLWRTWRRRKPVER